MKPINIISLINSLKTAFACSLGLVISYLMKTPSPQWTIITIIVVMASQNRVGAAIQKGSKRFLATIVGALVAALILFLFSVQTLILYIGLIIFVFLFTYLAGISKDYQDAFTVGSVTIVMILLTKNPSIDLAYDRFVEIMLGVFIALASTRLIYPIHSKFIIRKNLAKILRKTSELYNLAICQKQSFYSISQYTDLEEAIIQSLTLQPILLKEALLESIKLKKKKTHFITIHRLERRLLRSIYMMHESIKTAKGPLKHLLKSETFALLNQDILQAMKNIADKLENTKIQIPKLNLHDHSNDVVQAILIDMNYVPFDEQVRMGSFIFCIEYLMKILHRLNYIIEKI